MSHRTLEGGPDRQRRGRHKVSNNTSLLGGKAAEPRIAPSLQPFIFSRRPHVWRKQSRASCESLRSDSQYPCVRYKVACSTLMRRQQTLNRGENMSCRPHDSLKVLALAIRARVDALSPRRPIRANCYLTCPTLKNVHLHRPLN
jgi:hypothetical protein